MSLESDHIAVEHVCWEQLSREGERFLNDVELKVTVFFVGIDFVVTAARSYWK